MRIAHVVPALTRGGGERVVVDLSNHAFASGHDVRIIAFSEAPHGLAADIDPGVAIFYVAQSQGRIGRYLSALPWLLRNWETIAQLDVLHCHMTAASVLGTAVQAIKRLRGAQKPIIVETYHAVGMPIPKWQRWMHTRLAAHRDALALMAMDEYWRRFTARRPQTPFAVIPNGTRLPPPPVSNDRDAQLDRRRALHIPDSATRLVGTVGRLAAARRPWIYPDIFAGIARELGPDVHFVIGGEGPERERVEQAIADAGLRGRVHMPGLVREPFQLYPLLDLYVALNVGAVTGVAALEAAASGVPIVAVQLLDGHELGPDDWIWSSTDPDEVASKAVQLLRDPEALEATARRQRSHVHAHHSVDAMAKAYEHLYEAAIRSARDADRR